MVIFGVGPDRANADCADAADASMTVADTIMESVAFFKAVYAGFQDGFAPRSKARKAL